MIGDQPPLRLADVLWPARDQSIRQVVRDLSEPETGRPADNLLSNEDSVFRVSDQVGRVVPKGGIYLGVGPDQNFTLIAPSEPKLAFVIDFRRRNALVHFLHKALMTLAPTRADYLSRLLARTPRPLPPNPTPDDLVRAFADVPLDRDRLATEIEAVAAILRPLGLLDDAEWPELALIQRKLAGPGLNGRFLALPMYPTFGSQIQARDRPNQTAHFLARDAWYQTVRTLESTDRLIPLTGDFLSPTCLPKLADWLRARSLVVAAFYLADVEFFLIRSGHYPEFAAHLARLPWLPDAILIRTSTREIPHPDRLPGASSTTILRPVAPWLKFLQANPAPSLDRLFE